MTPTVLPAGYVAASGHLTKCPCQYGPSGCCTNGRHDECPRTWGWERHGEPQPETWIVGRRWGALTAVWRNGTACRWLCPCDCHSTVAGLFPPITRAARRRDVNRISSTDRLRRDQPDWQAALFAEVTS